MKLDNLRAFVSLFKDTLLALAGIAQQPKGWKLINTDGRRRADAEAVDAMRVKWMHTNPDIIADELAENILSTTDRARLVDAYKSRLVGVGVIDDIKGYVAGVDKYGDCENEADFVVKVETLCNEVNFVSRCVVEAIKKELGGVLEPQPITPSPAPQHPKSNRQKEDEQDKTKIAEAFFWSDAVKVGLVESVGGCYRWLRGATLYGYFVDVVTIKLGLRHKNEQRPWRLFKSIIQNHSSLLPTAQTETHKLDKGLINKPDGYYLVDSLFAYKLR